MNQTTHKILTGKAQNMSMIDDESVNLIVTSPPYPMIEMWDGIMAEQSEYIGICLRTGHMAQAFEHMHDILYIVWSECFRVLKDGGFLCVNIGDATRTTDGLFRVYDNHSKVVESCTNIGFTSLPSIIWRKQTNAPNKFMGSGMLPCGAYVTSEHEHILIFRKGGKRKFTSKEEKEKRAESAFFWEERNDWFSDVWDVKGTKQKLSVANSRERNASFPLEIPYRLISMFSCKDDVVLDPFVGCGTTTLASMMLRRNSIGIDIDSALADYALNKLSAVSLNELNLYAENRMKRHDEFISSRIEQGKQANYSFGDSKVVTRQETKIRLDWIVCVHKTGNLIKANYGYIEN